MRFRRATVWIAVSGAVLTVGGFGYLLASREKAQAASQPQIRTEAEPSLRAETATPPAEAEAEASAAPLGTPTLEAAVFSSDTEQAEPTATPGQQALQLSVDNLTEITQLYALVGHTDDVLSVAFSPDGSLVASGSADGTVRLWSATDGSPVRVLVGHSDYVNTVAFSPDGTLLATGSNDGSVRLWRVNDGTLARTIESSFTGRVLSLAFSPDGSLLAVADHLCKVQLRSTNRGILYRSLVQPNCVASRDGTVQSWGIEFSPDGEWIAVGEARPCCGMSLYLWPVDDEYGSPELLEGYDLAVGDLSYAPDGSAMAVTFLGNPVFWLLDAEDGSLIHTFEGHSYRVNCVVFSPDGDLLASGSADQTVRLWQIESGSLVQTLRGHEDEVTSVVFAADGRLIASASRDDTVILWGVESP